MWKRIRRWLFGPTTTDVVADFQKRFPGRCAVCSFDRFGATHGYRVGRPVRHACPEVGGLVRYSPDPAHVAPVWPGGMQ